MRLPIVFAALASCLWGQATAASDLYRRTHDALFASFLPVSELQSDPKLSQLLKLADDGMWAGAGQIPQFRQLIAPFTNLAVFGRACGIDELVSAARTGVYAEMTQTERRRALDLLQRCQD